MLLLLLMADVAVVVVVVLFSGLQRWWRRTRRRRRRKCSSRFFPPHLSLLFCLNRIFCSIWWKGEGRWKTRGSLGGGGGEGGWGGCGREGGKEEGGRPGKDINLLCESSSEFRFGFLWLTTRAGYRHTHTQMHTPWPRGWTPFPPPPPPSPPSPLFRPSSLPPPTAPR